MNLGPGQIINNTYRIVEDGKRGGFATVFKAVSIDEDIDDNVYALKVLHEMALSERTEALFRREAKRLITLKHPAVVRCHGIQRGPDERLILIMDYVEGPALGDYVRSAPNPIQPLTDTELKLLSRRLLGALADLHDIGIVHRDLSPDNLLLRGGRVEDAVIIDFGVAKDMSESQTLIGESFAGKLRYSAPEQMGLSGGFGAIGPRTDLYAAALVLAYAATGKPLLNQNDFASAIAARQSTPDTSHLPVWMQAGIAAALASEPDQRPVDARAMLALLVPDAEELAAPRQAPTADRLDSRPLAPEETSWQPSAVAAPGFPPIAQPSGAAAPSQPVRPASASAAAAGVRRQMEAGAAPGTQPAWQPGAGSPRPADRERSARLAGSQQPKQKKGGGFGVLLLILLLVVGGGAYAVSGGDLDKLKALLGFGAEPVYKGISGPAPNARLGQSVAALGDTALISGAPLTAGDAEAFRIYQVAVRADQLVARQQWQYRAFGQPLPLAMGPGGRPVIGLPNIGRQDSEVYAFDAQRPQDAPRRTRGFDDTPVTDLSLDGRRIAIGYGQSDRVAQGAGIVAVTDLDSTSRPLRLEGADARAGDGFGSSVALDRGWLAVGAPGVDLDGTSDAGSVSVMALPDTDQTRISSPAPQASGRFGAAVALEGAWLAVGEPGAGSVHLLRRQGNTWSVAQTLERPRDSGTAQFGAALAMTGERLLVGAPGGSGLTQAGAHLYQLVDGQWQSERVFRRPPEAGSAGDGFASAVALGDDLVVVGAPDAISDGKTRAGIAHAWILPAD